MLEQAEVSSNGALQRYAYAVDIPTSEDLFSAEGLEAHLEAMAEPPFSLIAVGDIMLAGRARKSIREHGAHYPFEAVRPLLRRAIVAVGNLEGLLAKHATRKPRRYSYRMKPSLAAALRRAGVNVVCLANNHLMDCGRKGVLETLEALASAGVAVIGAGVDEVAAHKPLIRSTGSKRLGLLSYYWNRRCAATKGLPGSAVDTPAKMAADIGDLRGHVDRIAVFFHWGVPYEREPSPEDRMKAHFAVDCGADIVIGHHPHVIHPVEVYRNRPIFYSIGNFTFGSGNSRAEGLLLGIHFDDEKTRIALYPVYVRNRDPRVAYQPKVLRGAAALRVLLQSQSFSVLELNGLFDNDRATLDIERTSQPQLSHD